MGRYQRVRESTGPNYELRHFDRAEFFLLVSKIFHLGQVLPSHFVKIFHLGLVLPSDVVKTKSFVTCLVVWQLNFYCVIKIGFFHHFEKKVQSTSGLSSDSLR